MPPICDLITANMGPDCTNELIAGSNDRFWIMNHSQISSTPRNVTYNNIITSILLDSGTNAYTVTGKNFSNSPAHRAVVEEFQTAYEHEVGGYIFAESDAIKRQLHEMKNGKMVIVTQNNYTGTDGDAAFTMYGVANGLKVMEHEQLKSDNPTLGAYRILWKSNPKALEPFTPNIVWDGTSLATTLTMLNALV